MRRRDFIVASTFAASGLVVPRVHAGGHLPADDDELNLAIIGVGTQGKVLLNAARQVPNVRFCAICDMWDYARNFGQTYLARYGHRANAYADFRELLDKEQALDGVFVATPDSAHANQVTACLEQGLHVYCEPMLAHTLDDTRRILHSAKASGKLLQVGFQRRSNPRYQHVEQRLLQEAHLIGTVTAAQTQWAQEIDDLRGWSRRMTIPDEILRQFGYKDMPQFRNWTWYPEHCGGPFCRHAVHQLDICQWFLGQSPRAVVASGGNDFYSDRAQWDTMMSVFEFPRPEGNASIGSMRAACNVFTTTSAGGMRQYERFLGTEGSIQISENPHWTRVGREPNARDWDEWVRKAYLLRPEPRVLVPQGVGPVEVHVSGELEAFQLPVIETEMNCAPHVANFCAAIRGKTQLACPANAAWASHVAVFKAVEAAQARKQLNLTEVDYQV